MRIESIVNIARNLVDTESITEWTTKIDDATKQEIQTNRVYTVELYNKRGELEQYSSPRIDRQT